MAKIIKETPIGNNGARITYLCDHCKQVSSISKSAFTRVQGLHFCGIECSVKHREETRTKKAKIPRNKYGNCYEYESCKHDMWQRILYGKKLRFI